jgi:hypothetical protein
MAFLYDNILEEFGKRAIAQTGKQKCIQALPEI